MSASRSWIRFLVPRGQRTHLWTPQTAIRFDDAGDDCTLELRRRLMACRHDAWVTTTAQRRPAGRGAGPGPGCMGQPTGRSRRGRIFLQIALLGGVACFDAIRDQRCRACAPVPSLCLSAPLGSVLVQLVLDALSEAGFVLVATGWRILVRGGAVALALFFEQPCPRCVSQTVAGGGGGGDEGSSYSRSASRPAPGLVASKSPPSAAKPVVLTYCSPVSLLSSRCVSSLSRGSEGSSTLPASPPCSLATTWSGLAPAPAVSAPGPSLCSSRPASSRGLSWGAEAAWSRASVSSSFCWSRVSAAPGQRHGMGRGGGGAYPSCRRRRARRGRHRPVGRTRAPCARCRRPRRPWRPARPRC